MNSATILKPLLNCYSGNSVTKLNLADKRFQFSLSYIYKFFYLQALCTKSSFNVMNSSLFIYCSILFYSSQQKAREKLSFTFVVESTCLEYILSKSGDFKRSFHPFSGFRQQQNQYSQLLISMELVLFFYFTYIYFLVQIFFWQLIQTFV